MRIYSGIILLTGVLFLAGACHSREEIVESETFLPGKLEVLRAIKDYTRSSGTHSKIYTMGICRKNSEEAVLVLSSIITYSELREYPPTSYFRIADDIILVYTGMEMVRKNEKLEQLMFRDLKVLIGNRLQNDLMSDDVTLNPDFKHEMFDPHPLEIRVFRDSVLINAVDAGPLSHPVIELNYEKRK